MNLRTKSVKQLQKESQSAMSLFEKTIARINKIQEGVTKAKERRIAKIDKLEAKISAEQAQIDDLVSIEVENDKRVTKLLNFLED